MSQLIKHYYINRETGEWATDTRFGLMSPNIKGLQIQHNLFNENNILYCLSTAPDYFEYSSTVSQSQLESFQNNANVTIISSTERQEEVNNIDPTTQQPSEETTTVTVFDIVYQEKNIIEENDGLQLVTQEEWDNEIVSFDQKQLLKRIEVIRKHRDTLLKETDWVVVKAKETGTNLSSEFKNWRQSLRDLPSTAETTFPSELPASPSNITVSQQPYNDYVREVMSIPMINDPLNQ